MSNRILLAVLAVGLLAATTGCGNRAGAGEGMQGKVFNSTAVSGGLPALVAGTTVTLRFTDDGRLIASAGCNQLQGEVTLDDGKLAVADLSETAMGCAPDLHEQDKWLSAFIRATPSWQLTDNVLTLTRGEDKIVLTAETPATLAGGKWTVDGLITGDAVSSVPGGVVATLEFGPKEVGVFAGCNNGSVPYTVDGATISFGDLVSTAMECQGDKGTVERAVTNVLSGKVTYKLDGQTLTLTNPSGAGLHLKK